MTQEVGAPHLGELETAVMEAVWTGRATTVRQVRGQLHPARPLGYTTVATIMTRLVDKGLLCRERSGKVDIFRAAYSREEYGRRAATQAVHTLLHEFGDVALAQFAAALESADPERLARLKARCTPPIPEDDHA